LSDLPTGWSSAAVTDLARFVRGVTYTKSDARETLAIGLIGIIRANNIGDFRLDLSDLVYVPERFVSSEQKLQIGDVVIATSSGSVRIVGKAAPVLTAMPLSFGAFCGVLRPMGEMEPRYFGRYFQSDAYRLAASAAARGVNINNLKRSHFDSFQIAFPGRQAQLRIAEKLDSVLSRVETCRARLDRVPQILKKFREAVLEAAVSGRLTHKNTDSNGGSSELPSGWTSSAFSELTSNIRTGTTAVPQDSPTKYPVLRSSSVRSLSVDLSDFRFLAKDQSANEDNFLAPGDLLFTRLSGSKEFVGNCAMVREVLAQRIQYPDRLFRARLKTPEAARYIEIAFASATVRKQVEAKVKSSAGHQRVSTDAITGALIPIPPKPIQESIVRIVDQLFAVADDLERRYKDSVLRVAKLTPSVLAKAFRGELVPQDPNDEPAGEMLERMLAHRTSPAK
jgi:type I restriction enzyme S subunit